MKKIIILLLIISCAFLIADDLVIYSYDSFVADWGIGGKVIPKFEEKYNCKVRIESAGDAGQLLSKTIAEKDNPKADIIIGLDHTMLADVIADSLFISNKPSNIDHINKDLIFDEEYRMIPFDYGYIAFIYNSEAIKNPPRTFGELQMSKWKKQLILIDPRTSSTGKCFFLYSIAMSGQNGWSHFWKSLKGNILSMPDSWGKAYNSFLAGEADIVLSYTTSQAYHEIVEDKKIYKALIMDEGGFRQIEAVGITNGAKNLELARKFVEFTLTDDFQNEVPENQWMYPVSTTAKLPKAFDNIAKPTKDISSRISTKDMTKNYKRWLKKWTKLMIQK